MISAEQRALRAILDRDRHVNLAVLLTVSAATAVVLQAGTEDPRLWIAPVLVLALGIEWWALRQRTTEWPHSGLVTQLVALGALGTLTTIGPGAFLWIIFAILLLFIRFTARGALVRAVFLLVAALVLLESGHRADHISIARFGIIGVAIITIAYITARSVSAIEEALEETGRLLRDTVTSISQGIVVIAPDGRIRYFNDRAAELLALPAEFRARTVHARDLFELQWQRGEIPEDASRSGGFTPAMLQDWPALRRLMDAHSVRRLADGRWLEMQTTETPGGDLVRTYTDVTTYQEASARAQVASEAKARFLANMSHELRTPMSAILGLSGLALESDLTERQRDWVRKIDAAGRQLLGLVDGILEASEPETSPDPASRPSFVVVAAVQSATVSAARDAQAKGVAFSVDVAPEVPRELIGDGRHLAQLIRHLVSNAVKFTSQGRIDVRIRSELVGSRAARLTVAVQDTGVGFSPDERERIFSPFEQGDTTASRAFGGTGIGLALAQRLAERLEGELGVESAPGSGSTFWCTVVFPLPGASFATHAARAAEAARRAARPVQRLDAPAAARLPEAPRRSHGVPGEPRRPSAAQARVIGLMRQLGDARSALARTPQRMLLLASAAAGAVSLVLAFVFVVRANFATGQQDVGVALAPTLTGLVLLAIAWSAYGRETLSERFHVTAAVVITLVFVVVVSVNGGTPPAIAPALIASVYITTRPRVARSLAAVVLAIAALVAIRADALQMLSIRTFVASVMLVVLMEVLMPAFRRALDAFASVSGELVAVSDELVAENQSLADASAAAEESARAKSDAMASVSHEIRTPVNAILGLSQVMQQGELTVKQRERLRKIEDSGQHLLALVNHVLDLSRLDAGRFVLDLEALALRPLLEQVRDAVGVDRSGKPVTFGIEVEADVPALFVGDRMRLTQLLLNYLSNALKYTERGRITLRVRREATDATSDTLRFEVQDTGIGIGEAQQARLFLPFEQVQDASRQRAGGAGLGLSISRWLAERMDGTVGVESRPGVGSTFWFTARLGRPLPGMTGATTDEAGRLALLERHGARVLVVDDNDINREVAGSLLRNAGLVIVEAESGLRAIALATSEAFDLVLMDLHMPGMDGFETTRRLRQEPRTAEVPIVALTANALPDVRQRCLDAGMNDYLSKPFRLDELGEVVARWVPAGRRNGAAPPVESAAESRAAARDESRGGARFDAQPASATPIVDDRALAALVPVARGLDTEEGLRRFMGDHGLYLSLLARFVESYADCVTEVEEALRRGDREHAELRVHTLKGVSATLGARGLAHACARLESAIRSDAPTALLAGALQDARDRLDAICEDLRNGLDLELAKGLDAEPLHTTAGTAPFDELDALLQSSDPDARDWAARNSATMATLAPDSRAALLAALDRFDLGTALAELREARSR